MISSSNLSSAEVFSVALLLSSFGVSSDKKFYWAQPEVNRLEVNIAMDKNLVRVEIVLWDFILLFRFLLK